MASIETLFRVTHSMFNANIFTLASVPLSDAIAVSVCVCVTFHMAHVNKFIFFSSPPPLMTETSFNRQSA